MPCYDYTNPVSSLFTNTEVTLPVSGTTYSFNTLYWICNFSLTTQLKVFKKNSGTNTTVQLILNTDFTIDEQNTTITTLTSLTGYDQIVIQRVTLSDQMITRFTEGAKLTAKDLNDCFHQLLFVTQEKDYTNSTININYSLATSVAAWNNGTNYVVGDIVSYNNKIYKCILATNSVVPTNTTNWTLINPTLNGFYITGTNSSIEFDFSNLSVGKALIWNGTKFVGSLFTGALNSLSDIDVDPVSNKDILVYDTSNSNKWTAKSPTVDITEANLKFSDKVFYPSSNTSWFNPINSAINISGGSVATALSGFKDNSNRWVVTDAPTVYHIVKKILPNETDPITFFSDVKTDLDAAVQNLTNPVKLKLYWNLNHNRQNIQDAATLPNVRSDDAVYNDNLGNFKSAFWHKPEELYNINGYDMSAVSPLLRHGVVNASNTYLTSPYFTQQTVSGVTTYVSKLEGYGIKAFYLSVPECKVTTIHLPVLYNSGGNYVFAQLSNIAVNAGNLSKALATPGNEWNTVDGSLAVGNGYKDYYLMGLRDMAFAAARPRPTNVTTDFVTVYNTNRGWVSNDVSRWQKSKIIGVWYSSRVGATLEQWRNVNYKRFETSDSALPVLWKIPDQIVYFNKCALANSIEGSNPYDLNMDSPGEATPSTGARALLRFTGYHRLQINSASNSSTSQNIEGLYYKANSFWQEFQNRWTEHTQDNQNYKYNEADIDWYLYNVSNTSTTPKVYRSTIDIAPFTAWFTGAGNVNNQTAAMAFPWIYRPNDIKSGNNANSSAVSNIAAIGTGLYNIDANKLFSESDQFIEDPCDEFVYRIVSKTSILNYLKETGVKHLKSAIILEHGFTDLSQSGGNSEILTNLQSQYPDNIIEPTTKRAWSRLFESKIKVYVKDEKVEQSDGVNRYVITLVIRVPRLKSIGYSKIFRKWTSTTSTPPAHLTTSDGNPELGPWTYDIGNGYISTTSISDFIGGNNAAPGLGEVDLFRDNINNSSATTRTLTLASYGGTTTNASQTVTYHPAAIGRNEAAVKFTSIGIPSNLWIRLSVLNTDGTTALLDGTNANFGFTSSTFAN